MWSLFSRIDALLLFHWWVKVMYLIYWRKVILKTSFCCLQQRFIHRTVLLSLLLSKSFGDILKLQSAFTHIKTLECRELQPICFRRKYGFSLFRYFIKFSTHIFSWIRPIQWHIKVCADFVSYLLNILLTFVYFPAQSWLILAAHHTFLTNNGGKMH